MSNPETGQPDGSGFVAPDTSRRDAFLADTARFNQPTAEPPATAPPVEAVAPAWTKPGLELNPTPAPLATEPAASAIPSAEQYRSWVSPVQEAAPRAEATPEATPANLAQLGERRTQQIIDGAKRVGGRILGFLARVVGYGAAGVEVGGRAAVEGIHGGVQAGFERIAREQAEAYANQQALGSSIATNLQAGRERVGQELSDAYQYGVKPAAELAGTTIKRGYETTANVVRSGVETVKAGSRWTAETAVGTWHAGAAGISMINRWSREGIQAIREAGPKGLEFVKGKSRELAGEAGKLISETSAQALDAINNQIKLRGEAVDRTIATAKAKLGETVQGAQLHWAKGQEQKLLNSVLGLENDRSALDQKLVTNRGILQRAARAVQLIAGGRFEPDQLGSLVSESRLQKAALAEVMKLQGQRERLAAKLRAKEQALAAATQRRAQYEPAVNAEVPVAETPAAPPGEPAATVTQLPVTPEVGEAGTAAA